MPKKGKKGKGGGKGKKGGYVWVELTHLVCEKLSLLKMFSDDLRKCSEMCIHGNVHLMSLLTFLTTVSVLNYDKAHSNFTLIFLSMI